MEHNRWQYQSSVEPLVPIVKPPVQEPAKWMPSVSEPKLRRTLSTAIIAGVCFFTNAPTIPVWGVTEAPDYVKRAPTKIEGSFTVDPTVLKQPEPILLKWYTPLQTPKLPPQRPTFTEEAKPIVVPAVVVDTELDAWEPKLYGYVYPKLAKNEGSFTVDPDSLVTAAIVAPSLDSWEPKLSQPVMRVQRTAPEHFVVDPSALTTAAIVAPPIDSWEPRLSTPRFPTRRPNIGSVSADPRPIQSPVKIDMWAPNMGVPGALPPKDYGWITLPSQLLSAPAPTSYMWHHPLPDVQLRRKVFRHYLYYPVTDSDYLANLPVTSWNRIDIVWYIHRREIVDGRG